jgi:hypothetical protein
MRAVSTFLYDPYYIALMFNCPIVTFFLPAVDDPVFSIPHCMAFCTLLTWPFSIVALLKRWVSMSNHAKSN